VSQVQNPVTPTIDFTQSLDALTASLVEDVRTAPEHEALSPEIRLRKEALLTTRVLVSKLHMVRTTPTSFSRFAKENRGRPAKLDRLTAWRQSRWGP